MTTPNLFGSQTGNMNFKPGFGQQQTQLTLFGTTAPNTGLVGAPASSTTGLSFGAPAASTAPTFGALGGTTTGFGGVTAPPAFGAPTASAAPSFGAPASSAPTFGAPSSTAPAFGATAPTFGAQAPAFGAPASSAAPAFAVTATSAAPAFGVAGTGATPSTGISFGAPATSAAPSFSFGASTTTATPPTFGAPTTQSIVLFNPTSTAAPTTQSIVLFNPTSTAAPASGFSFGTSTAKPALTFGTPSTASTGFGIGTSSATTTSTGLSFGLGGTTANTLTLTGPLASSTANVGLGGVQTTQTKVVTTQKEIPPKEQALPNEILQTVEQFKGVMKQSKLHSSEIARCSVKDFRKVEHEIEHFTNLLSDIEGQLQKNRSLAEKLKHDTAKCLQNIEMAQRTQDTPPGLQYENTAPLKFFQDLANHFEREMQVLKLQIESAEKYVRSHCSPDALSAQDLGLGMRKLHETFIALAGRLQSVHSQVESQKEFYLNFRKQFYNDESNPFVVKLSNSKDAQQQQYVRHPQMYSPPKVAAGPTPFSTLSLSNANPLTLQQNQTAAVPAFPPKTTAPSGAYGGLFGGTYQQPNTNTLFGSPAAQNTTFGQNAFGTTNSSFGTPTFGSLSNFQLQKPPTGNKRGKQ